MKLLSTLLVTSQAINDECSDGTHLCGANADCTDTLEAYTCACKAGYTTIAKEAGYYEDDPNGENCVPEYPCCQAVKVYYSAALTWTCTRDSGDPVTYPCTGYNNAILKWYQGDWKLMLSETSTSWYYEFPLVAPEFCWNIDSTIYDSFGNGAYTECLDDRAPIEPPTEPPTEPQINCYDGSNGGCSHLCDATSASCSCPDCWELSKI